MRLQKQPLKEWQYTRTDGQVQYLLAPDLEHAAWAAAELSGGTQFLKDVKRCDEWAQNWEFQRHQLFFLNSNN